LDRDLKQHGLYPEIHVKTTTAVHTAKVAFRGLPKALGLSGHGAETLMVRIEVDTRPPAGAVIARSRINRHGQSFEIRHHDLPSMFAGKLHAVLTRQYAKGRDLFDLAWYLQRSVAPNLPLLNSALTQTGWAQPPLTIDTWKARVRERVRSVSWQSIQRDVAKFLPRAEREKLNLASLLGSLEGDISR
jgi:hypothetical protein